MRKQFICAVITFLLMTSTWAKLKPTDSSKPILLKNANSLVIIKVASNPTTGFSWFLDHLSSNIIPLGYQYVAPKTKLIGAGGYSIWTFHVKKSFQNMPGVATITLSYQRPWVISKGKVSTFHVVWIN